MNAERFKRITNIFDSARKLHGKARASFLREHCANDAGLQHEVEAMLVHDDRPGGVISTSGAGDGARLLAAEIARTQGQGGADPLDEIPTRIGCYRVIRKVGEGGMGAVFEAEQDKPRRIVALKVIRPGLATNEMHRRFEYEAEVLGRLRHPGIAQIFEAGTAQIETPAGISATQPFFAMEFIRGRPLIEYARSGGDTSQGLDTRARLALCAKVCDALQHAHQNGVIHRDLKPDNILVDEHGQPKILDFGVARAVDADLQAMTMHTEVGQLIGTLAYMSPEQLGGEVAQIDTRSDVYAAGIVLYQLLTFHLPFDVRDRSITEAARTICDEKPTPLGKIDASLRGDVETIVAKAIEKDKTRRYQTAGELARDIRHYLAGEPIEAKRDSTLYVLSKTLSQHKVAVGTAAVFVIMIAASTVALLFMYSHQTRATALAQAEATKANTVIELLKEMLGSADPGNVKGRDYTVRQLLDDFAVDLSDQLADQPEVNATIHSTIGNAYLGLAKFDEAEIHLTTAMNIRRRVLGDEHPAVAASLSDQATLNLRRGNYDQAEKLYREALAMRRKLFDPPHASIASNLDNLGMLLQHMGHFDAAEPGYREALDMRRALFGEKHLEVAQSLNSLALLLQHTGELAQAEPLYREALTMHRELLVEVHPRIAENAYDLASLLMTKGEFDEAEKLFRESLRINEELYGDQHPSVAASRIGLAAILRNVARYDEAESLYRRALATLRQLQGGEHSDQGVILNNLALVLKDKGDYDEAKSLHLEALDLRRRLLGEDHHSVANSLTNLAGLLKTMGEFDQAESMYGEAMALGEKAYGNKHPRQAIILQGLGDLLLKERRYAEAQTSLERALDIYTDRFPPGHRRTIRTVSLLGQCLVAQRAYQKAESLLLKGYDSVDEGLATRTLRQRDAFAKLIQSTVELYDAWGKPEKAAEWRTKLPPPDAMNPPGPK